MANRAVANAHAKANAAYIENGDEHVRLSSYHYYAAPSAVQLDADANALERDGQESDDPACAVVFRNPDDSRQGSLAGNGVHRISMTLPTRGSNQSTAVNDDAGLDGRETLPLLGNSRTQASRQRSATECSCEADTFGSAWGNRFSDDPHFATAVRKVEHAILSGLRRPERIVQGSSGSYFVREAHGHRVGVFKPKDEEPYGRLNPKFTKWMHKVCCPCCFGRSCLVPNQGYLSEAGAYLVDLHLQLNVVPPTHIVRLASDAFNYDAIAREKARIKRQLSNRFPELARHLRRLALPPKKGSLQLFVAAHRDADFWLRRFDAEPQLLQGALRRNFLLQFQKLTVLDYVIRNTDRGNDNWLIRYDPPRRRKRVGAQLPRSFSAGSLNSAAQLEHDSQVPFAERPRSVNSSHNLSATASQSPVGSDVAAAMVDANEAGSKDTEENEPVEFDLAKVHIAAIDNGLAFPFKHPDEVRSYPFGWSWLAIAKEPFLDELADLVLPRLQPSTIDTLCTKLRTLFRTDRGFDARTFESQMDVLRGQVLNLERALRERLSPAQLAAMPPVLVHTEGTGTRQSFMKRNPCFSCW